ncbi:MAG: hypothetical protein S4CHLAM20_02720 [Chlamydiia bacterium]|nr:hypothetical protein [Chlamydiia bacterium]
MEAYVTEMYGYKTCNQIAGVVDDPKTPADHKLKLAIETFDKMSNKVSAQKVIAIVVILLAAVAIAVAVAATSGLGAFVLAGIITGLFAASVGMTVYSLHLIEMERSANLSILALSIENYLRPRKV